LGRGGLAALWRHTLEKHLAHHNDSLRSLFLLTIARELFTFPVVRPA
jgi:hypothetical protein